MKTILLTSPEPSEAAVMDAVRGALAYHPKVAWYRRMNTGAGKLVYAGGQSQWLRFGFPGLSDFIGQLKDGRFLAVEVKRPSGRLTNDQIAFLAIVNDGGGVGFCAKCAEDVFTEIPR